MILIQVQNCFLLHSYLKPHQLLYTRINCMLTACFCCLYQMIVGKIAMKGSLDKVEFELINKQGV